MLDLERHVCFPMQVGDMVQRATGGEGGVQAEQRQGGMKQHGSFQELRYDHSVGHAGGGTENSPCCGPSWVTLEQAASPILEMSPSVQ